jgi:Fic family protein
MFSAKLIWRKYGDDYIRHLNLADIWRIMKIMSKYQAFFLAKIPYDLKMTSRMVHSLMKIAECKPFLDEILSTPLELKLHRQAKIRAITYSNQIEGNKLNEKAVTAILGSHRKAGLSKDEKEVLNYKEALSYAEELAKEKTLPSVRDFCDLQKLITKNVIDPKQSGRIRTIDVSIVDESSGREIEKCPEPQMLPNLMGNLWEWLRETEGENPYVRAFGFHFIAVTVHPIADGNGRTARLFQHLLLLKQGEDIARYIPSETIVMRNRDRYYSAIRQSRKLESLHPMIEFLAECFATCCEEVVEEGKKLFKQAKDQKPSSRYKKILSFGKSKGIFQSADLLEALPSIPRRTLERDLQQLVKEKKLIALGEKKGRKYRVRSK